MMFTILKALGNYVRVHTAANMPLFHSNLSYLEKKFSSDLFFRANRSILVNLRYVKNVNISLKGLLILQMENGAEIELSQRQTSSFRGLTAL